MSEETVDITPITFVPEVLARISPELSLQRHLALGYRPSLKGFEEFRDVLVNQNTLSRYQSDAQLENVIGSNVLKVGNTFIVTTITGGIIEDSVTYENTRNEKFGLIYPVVEVHRGRSGACTDEEMTLSQRLYDNVLQSGIISKESLMVKPGVRITNDDGTKQIIYLSDENTNDSDEDEVYKSLQPNRKWSYTLYAKVKVFSRTGPLFDSIWNSLMYALRTVRLPRSFIDERATDLKMTVRTRGKSAIIRETYDILCDPNADYPLKLNKENIGFASNFGIINLDPECDLVQENDANEEEEMEVDDITTKPIKSILLADIDSEAEESSVQSTISIVAKSDGTLKYLSIFGGKSKVTPEMIKKSIFLAQQRSKDLKEREI